MRYEAKDRLDGGYLSVAHGMPHLQRRETNSVSVAMISLIYALPPIWPKRVWEMPMTRREEQACL